MKCRFPISIKKPNGEVVSVPCGQCVHCRLNKSRQWSIRMTHEQLKYGDKSCFLTLTYDDKHLPKDQSIHKEHVQKFLKRLRKELGVEKVRYFACGEYGENGVYYGLVNGRPHYHLVLFGVPVDSPIFKNRHVHYENGKPCGWHADLASWSDPKTHEYYGKVHVGTVTPESTNYVAGYLLKKVQGKGAKEYYDSLGIEPEFALMSRRPGIGADYVYGHYDYYSKHRFVTIKGVKYPLPRFYADKLEKASFDVEKYKEYLLSQGWKPEELDRAIHAKALGFDPILWKQDGFQAEKNTIARLSLRRNANV